MEVVYERTIELYHEFSSKIIKSELKKRYTESMLTEILMPLSCEEVLLEDMFGELVEKNLIGENAPSTDRNIHIDWNLLTVKIWISNEIIDNFKTLYN